MANPEHVEILLAGADAVRQWRDENPEGFLDLREANLANTNLHTVDLRQVSEFGLPQLNCTADFTGANLSGAAIIAGSLAGSRMCGASFSNATFQSADLASTNLQHADFTGASIAISRFTDARLNIANFQSSELFAVDFGRSVGGFSAHSGADLSGVNFSIATLMNCSFNGSKLTETNFTNATMYGVQFADTDLSTANGLDSLRFSGPSGIDIETLFRSRNLPDSFLRGCGVPEDLITYLSSLTGAAFDFYSCFISHSSRNDEFARRLHARMQQEKLRVWFAPEDMRGGRKSGDQIDSAIRLHD